MARDQPSPPTRPLWREYQEAKSRDTRAPRDYSAFLESLVLTMRIEKDRTIRRHIVQLEDAYSKGYDAGMAQAFKDIETQQQYDNETMRDPEAKEPDE